MLGGLLVSVAATTFNKPSGDEAMQTMVAELRDKKGEAFDEEFINQMIMHHQGAIEVASLAKDRAKHQEIKDLSGDDITSTQEQKIDRMKGWRGSWGYKEPSDEGM